LEAEPALPRIAERSLVDLSAFQSPSYRLLWIGTLASFATNPIRFSAGILFLTNSAPDDVRFLLAGVLGAISGLVTLLFGMIGGALADRFNRRRLLIAAQAVLIAATVGVGVTMALDVNAASLTLFFSCIFVGAAAMSVDMPARQALVAEVVPPGVLANAVALDSVAMMIAMPVALPVAGVLIDVLGYGGAYGCAAIGYVIALAVLLPLKYQPASRLPSRRALLSDIRLGVSYVRGSPPVLWTLTLFFILMALAFPLVASFGPVWVTEVLGLSATEFGFFAAAWGLGAISASLVMTGVGHFPAKGWLFIAAVLVFSLLVLVWAYSRSVPLSAVVNFSLGASFTVIQISARSLIQRAVPLDLQGRVLSLLMLNLAVANIAGLAVGGLAQLASLEVVTAVLGWTAFGLVLTVVLTRPAIRRIGEIEPETA
jgi:MFS family permease